MSCIDTIAFLVTKKCTAECDICCFSCSPKETEEIDFTLVHRVIDEASKFNSIKTIGFSGGEPFLLFNEIVEATKVAAKNNFRVTCTTNGFWAVDENTTYEKLKILKNNGLYKLGISVDEFHNEYVNIDNIKRIIDVCKSLNILVDVGSVITKNKNNVYNLMNKINDSMVGVKHQLAHCLPVGNAIVKFKEEDFYYDSKVITSKNLCDSLVYLAIMSNGDVFPCCSQAGATAPLNIGNITDTTLDSILKKFNSNINIRLLKKKGLIWYLNVAKINNIDKFVTKKYVNKCHLCRSIFLDKEFMKLVEPYSDEFKLEIYARYKESLQKELLDGNCK